MKCRLPGATSLIPPSSSPELTLYILTVRTYLFWKVWSAQFLVLKIPVSLEHKSEEVCFRRPHLFLPKAAGLRGLACRDPWVHQPHPAGPFTRVLPSAPREPTLSGHQAGQLSSLMSPEPRSPSWKASLGSCSLWDLSFFICKGGDDNLVGGWKGTSIRKLPGTIVGLEPQSKSVQVSGG